MSHSVYFSMLQALVEDLTAHVLWIWKLGHLLGKLCKFLYQAHQTAQIMKENHFTLNKSYVEPFFPAASIYSKSKPL